MELNLRVEPRSPFQLTVGYDCPCGCTPSVEYERGTEHVGEGCCCGNQFAVGTAATEDLRPQAGSHREIEWFDAPWDERVEAAWMIGPSEHVDDGGTEA